MAQDINRDMSVLPILLYLSVTFTYTSAKCSRGEMESFILSTNALPSPSSYKNIPGSSLVECTRTCLEDANCQSFIFLRNRNETECRLTTNILGDSKKRQEQLLMPTLGTYYMEKVCLKGGIRNNNNIEDDMSEFWTAYDKKVVDSGGVKGEVQLLTADLIHKGLKFATRACDRLFVAESLRGMELTDHNDRVIANSSRLSCLESCLNSKTFVCKSVEFDSKTNECKLSRHDRFDRKIHFKKSASASLEYFDVTCPYEQRKTPRGGQGKDLFSPPPNFTRGLAVRKLFRVPPCCEGTTHLQTSMPSPGFKLRPYGTVISVGNHYFGWATGF
ncbi:uncharacterized protein TNCV_4992871 [Trichonephila clavipes]|nr:uncharacterized protein TNCV_4992871 [Trichonephila clavipes]